jgi:heterotetrameric sarcosine oxidase gamma subunit
VVDFKLHPSDALIGLPIEIGETVLTSVQPASIVSVAPFKGQGMAVNDALKTVAKIVLPTVGMATSKKHVRAMWAGQGQWFVIGDIDLQILTNELDSKAAVTDQSDAWVVFTLSGADATEVMSRLCSLDLGAMEIGQTARAEFAHMMSCITPVPEGFEIMIMRSFAKTAIHHTREAMSKLAAQRAL